MKQLYLILLSIPSIIGAMDNKPKQKAPITLALLAKCFRIPREELVLAHIIATGQRDLRPLEETVQTYVTRSAWADFAHAYMEFNRESKKNRTKLSDVTQR